MSATGSWRALGLAPAVFYPAQYEATTSMANTPNKIKGPTEAALSAIQEALSARDASAEAQAGPPAPQVSAAAELQWLGTSPAPDADVRQSAEEICSRSADNNERQPIGNLLRALHRRPEGTSFLTPTLFAGLWLLAGLVVAWIYLPAMWPALGPTAIAAPLLTIVFFVPIIFFYVVAHMRWRSQELRLITQSIAEVAMRFAEPETVARESIVTIGQAIRRELAALGDGVERALGRAAELETRVGNELSALEHAYSETEARIRGLLQDLRRCRPGDRNALTTASVEAIGARAEQLTASIKAATGEAERALGSLSTSASASSMRASVSWAKRSRPTAPTRSARSRRSRPTPRARRGRAVKADGVRGRQRNARDA